VQPENTRQGAAPPWPDGIKAVAVVVTHNRANLLGQCLEALERQTTPVYVVVVDNASVDDTASVLSKAAQAWRGRLQVIRSAVNLGGAGGFALGMEFALRFNPRWLWLMDDDSRPQTDALGKLLEAEDRARKLADGRALGFLASQVLWRDQTLHRMNEPGRLGRAAGYARAPGLEEVDYASFVSVLVRTEAVRTCGLPIADFFLGSDDVEFTWRLTRHGLPGFYVHDSRVYHLTAANAGMNIWKMPVTPDNVEQWTVKARNLVAVNRRRPWGWLREPVRALLLRIVWAVQGMDPALRRRLCEAVREGLRWQYEPLIRYPD
jgi:GT2 family glycosyltransferase